jgi:hypothetical protein
MKKKSCCRIIIALLAILFFNATVIASNLLTTKGKGFPLSENGKSCPLFISENDHSGVIRALKDLQSDIGKVTRATPELAVTKLPGSKQIVIAGTLGTSAIIDKLVKSGKLKAGGIRDKWETFMIVVISKPLPGIKEALVIVGSDKRGTIYGIYELSAKIGVSPWYWWADVPIEHKEALYINRNMLVVGPPAVKYRGIFLNDEHPNLTNWILSKYGFAKVTDNPPVPQGIANYNSAFYTKLFELILRLKGNYLWPAMWNNAFNEDDPENPRLADEYGIVMGTSHQEPMVRAQKEWDRRYLSTIGTWNYAKHPEILQEFWREGIRRNKNYESIVTMGLRGANDTEMAPGGPEANRTMLEDIVKVQRNILTGEMNQDVTKIPQMWCLYKEVQEYYNAGMRVPDDVTLLWAEDNWGNIRRVPSADERKRTGGAGIYYHFDYHGGPRSYQWMNTSPIPKIWDQLTFARQYGADRIWIVNVGHFKAYSFPIHYFMDLAWYGDSLTNDNMREYTRDWAIQQFGTQYANEAAEILTQYTRFNGRRKPELLTPQTYSLVNYREAEKVVADFNDLTRKAGEIYDKLPAEKRDAWYQLILFPTKASALVNELYLAAARNDLYALQKRTGTNKWAAETERLFSADTSLMGYFNNKFAGGKWSHFMDQPHLGYISWRDPPVNSLQHIKLKKIDVPQAADMGISPEGTAGSFPDSTLTVKLPEFDIFNKQSYYLDIFNRGKTAFSYEIDCEPWIRCSDFQGEVEDEKRIWVSVDWDHVITGRNVGVIKISGTGKTIEVEVSALKPSEIVPETLQGFIESNGYVSIEAAHFLANTQPGSEKWLPVEDYGHTLSGMRATAGVEIPELTPGKDAPCLEYKMYLFSTGAVEVNPYVAPSLNFLPGRAVRYAVSFDNDDPQIVTLVPKDFDARNGNSDWEKTVSDNYRIGKSLHTLAVPGYHILKIWMIDPGVVIQKIVVNTGGVKPSYLGPPESYCGVISN